MVNRRIIVYAAKIISLLISSIIILKPANGDGEKSGLEYMELVLSKYSAYETYEDIGALDIIYYENDREVRRSSVDFFTRFKRTGEFEISWQKNMGIGEGLSYRIWRSNGVVTSQYGGDAPFESKSLYDALARAVGISNSLTFYIPCMLMPSMECTVCDSGESFTLTYPASKIKRPDLKKINIKYKSRNTESFLVDAKNFQIREIEWWNEFDNSRVYHHITYKTINAESSRADKALRDLSIQSPN